MKATGKSKTDVVNEALETAGTAGPHLSGAYLAKKAKIAADMDWTHLFFIEHSKYIVGHCGCVNSFFVGEETKGDFTAGNRRWGAGPLTC